MSARPKSNDPASELRRLRREIARQRRRLDRRVDDLFDRALLIGKSREFVRDHPARSVLSATGAGILLGDLIGLRRTARRLGSSMFEMAFEQAWPRLCRELRQLAKNWRENDSDEDTDNLEGNSA